MESRQISFSASLDMMSSKLISFPTLAAIYCCCIQLLFLQVSCATNGAAEPTSCSSAFMECADLNISYPFWSSASCAASPSYVLSNCTSSPQAYWDSFSSAAHGVVGPPAVTSIVSSLTYNQSSAGKSTWASSIQLSWNTSLIDMGYCGPLFYSENLSQYNIPSSINLTGFSDSSAIEFSANSTYLLFNCTNNASNVLAQLGSQDFQSESSSGCLAYKGLCTGQAKTPCIQWKVSPSTKKLMLQHVLDSLSCSQFTFGTTSVSESGSIQWSTGSIELIWKDIQCEKCQNANGVCVSDRIIPAKFNHCECHNTAFDFSTQTCSNKTSDDCGRGFSHCSTGAKISIVVVLAIVVLAIVFALQRKYCGSEFRKEMRVRFFNFIKAIFQVAIGVLKKVLRKLQTSSFGPSLSLRTMDLEGLTERPIQYSYSSIASATKSFSSRLGEGGFGTVYKGSLPQSDSPDLQIAVKVLEVRSKHSKQQFLNEVITIGRIHHVNVVRLLGFCMQEDHEMLVYEFVENGSLDRWLFDKPGSHQTQVLDWGQRYAIALGIARGLSYLHEECRHRTVHCDIKPQNILLDEEMCPKIADFGLAKLMSRDESKVVTMAKGTPGYMAPEFWMGGQSHLSTKFDVYSYGMVLLELISGQRNFQRNVTDSVLGFPAMAFKAAMQGDLKSILDTRLGITKDTSDADEAQNLHWHQIKTAVFVALWCIQDHPTSRPCMSEVVKYLEGGAAVSECPPQPTISISSTSSIPQELLSTSHQDGFTSSTVGR